MSEIIKKFDLLRCPFCGGSAIMESWDMVPYERANIESSDGKWYSIFCNECLSYGGDYPTVHEAAKAWNTRVKG